MNRRTFLSVLGGGVIVAAGSAGLFAATRTPDGALAPWEMAGSHYDEPRRRALSYAVLAPNPHNRQPWLVDLDTPGKVTLLVDRTKMLPETDPLNRQITIGLGCFLELFVLAAQEDGYRVDLDLFPDGESSDGLTDGRVAVARFTPDAAMAPDPLFAHVLARRSNKEPFDTTRTVEAAAIPRLIEAARDPARVGGSVAAADVEAGRALTAASIRREFETPRTLKESVDLLRIGKAEIEANPDGIDLGGLLFDSLNMVGMMSREAALDTSDPNYRQALEGSLENANTAMGHLWLVTTSNTRADQIAAGRDWLRLHLAATRDGVAFHPLSQALQEFPEMAEYYAEAHRRFAPRGGTVQMLVRLGYGPEIAPSPRWPLEAKIVV